MDGSSTLDPRSLYERDFAAWTEAQARAMRARDAAAIDWANVIEEIESLGRFEKRSLASALRVLLEHRIKLDHGRNLDPARGWRVTIADQQDEIADILADNPSLHPLVPTLIDREWPRARRKALDSFAEYEPDRLASYRASLPATCPYSVDDVLG